MLFIKNQVSIKWPKSSNIILVVGYPVIYPRLMKTPLRFDPDNVGVKP